MNNASGKMNGTSGSLSGTSEILERAEQRFRDGDLESAINLCAEVLKHEPKHILANIQVGLAAKALGEREEAERYFRTAAASTDNDARPHVELARLLIDAQRLNEAARTLTQAVAADPLSAPAQLWLGRVRHLTMDSAGAALALERAAELNPDDAEIQFHLGRALAENNSRADDATHVQRRAIELGNYRADYVWPAVNWHLIRDETNLAEDYVRAMIARRPVGDFDPARDYTLGEILNAQERTEEAHEALQTALARCESLSPTSSRSRHDIDAYRARILHEMGERDKAESVFRGIGQSSGV